jgi:hypothetical protein
MTTSWGRRNVRRVVAGVVAAVFVMVAGCSSGEDDVRSGSGPDVADEATTDDSTEVFDPDGGASDDEPEEDEPSEVEPSTSPSLAVVGNVVVPDGEPGELSVVLQGLADPISGSVPVVVRNMTDETVYSIEASATARGADGSLAGSGSSQGFTPTTVGAGEWAFGYLYFGADVPADATLDITATAESDDGFLSNVDVTPVESNVTPSQYTGQQVVGIVANETGADVGGPVSVSVLCMDAAGTAVTASHFSFTDADTIPADGTASYAVDLFDDPCPNYAVGASGFDF